MAESGLSDETNRFLAAHIRSVEQLEIILLLGGSPERSWSAAEVYRVVLSNENSVAHALEKFVADALLRRISESPARYQFAPVEAADRVVIGQLAADYPQRRVRIIQAIYSPPASAVEEFARAFHFRKKD